MVDSKPTNNKHNTQAFDYLFVLDFEATCWDKSDQQKGLSEIIEFSVVSYNTKSNEIIAEFQQYVMPMENPKLSAFCTNLTGITQQQVDKGVPLGTCLMIFSKWLNEQMDKCAITFPNHTKEPNSKNAVFVTWSDWDLKTCLRNECRRKRINKSDWFNMWIDLRALYIEHYDRKPKGLHGALMELGLKFIGNEHCGLDDARNTALLAGRMINDGILLRITKDITPNC